MTVRLFALGLLAAALFAVQPAAAQERHQNPHEEAPAAGGESPENIFTIERDDTEMAAAEATARRSLPDFWKRHETDAEVRETGVVQVKFPTSDNGREDMWVSDLKRAGGKITGILANEPVAVPSLKSGQTVTVDPANIIDWGYRRSGLRYGYFTARLLVSRMSPEEAKQFGGEFAATTIEP